jgi:diadenosine tetraphosphate (Ap4A) HIT family hydrolase
MPWWPKEQWRDMIDGVDCPMCADAHLAENKHGELIAELPGSYARLVYNQTQTGYAVVIAKRHVPELFDFNPEELRLFWTDVSVVAQAVAKLWSPVKIDYLVMGHLCPHVHCHVYPQYEDCDPHRLLNPQEGSVRVPKAEFTKRLKDMQRMVFASNPEVIV